MPYNFTFDLTKVSFFFTEIAAFSVQKQVHKSFFKAMHEIIAKFKIQEATGLNLDDALILLEDFVELKATNLSQRGKFLETEKRAFFVPHCSRKYLDGRCHATFDVSIPSYVCANCSSDCLVNEATSMAKNKGYGVYVLSGGSCIPNILQNKRYEGVVGVACGEEIKMLFPLLHNLKIPVQTVPLLKNGCANTFFSMKSLAKIL